MLQFNKHVTHTNVTTGTHTHTQRILIKLGQYQLNFLFKCQISQLGYNALTEREFIACREIPLKLIFMVILCHSQAFLSTYTVHCTCSFTLICTYAHYTLTICPYDYILRIVAMRISKYYHSAKVFSCIAPDNWGKCYCFCELFCISHLV